MIYHAIDTISYHMIQYHIMIQHHILYDTISYDTYRLLHGIFYIASLYILARGCCISARHHILIYRKYQRTNKKHHVRDEWFNCQQIAPCLITYSISYKLNDPPRTQRHNCRWLMERGYMCNNKRRLLERGGCNKFYYTSLGFFIHG